MASLNSLKDNGPESIMDFTLPPSFVPAYIKTHIFSHFLFIIK